MRFFSGLWTTTISIVNWLTFSPLGFGDQERGIDQLPINEPAITAVSSAPITALRVDDGHSPPYGFKPPGGRLQGPGSDFYCDYSNMPEWKFCSTPENRECWLRHPDGREFNIHTDYEKFTPIGIDRYYTLNVTNATFNADGQPFPLAKLFNGSFPGPWIQACWGDTVHINVTNYLPYNGTSIHWHGIRQFLTNQMDGVNGITQCPIAPETYFEYKWKTLQYGSSWYHSHYSVQYADGLQGPMTIHGPSSAPYDEPKTPLLMTDWDHASAYQVIYGAKYSKNASIVLNGKGNVTRYSNTPATIEVPEIYTLHFEERNTTKSGRAKRYLLRLINTSFGTNFVFSIDNHWIQVIGADFVPVEPYYTKTVHVAIGQRYHVIVEANPVPYGNDPLPDEWNFWIRTNISSCPNPPSGVNLADYMKTGILRYNQGKAIPRSHAWPIPQSQVGNCTDEPYDSLVPKLPWTIGSPVNEPFEKNRDIRLINPPYNASDPSDTWAPLITWALGDVPLQIEYSDPIFLHFDNYNAASFPDKWVVIPENYTSADWVYILVTGNLTGFAMQHPLHLHGHDFAILQVDHNPYTPERLQLRYDNPPRRDVVLVPRGGFVVIAFKADNPGSWLMHCHIARHASEGLAMQILERQEDANKLWPHGSSPAIADAERVCDNWQKWQENRNNWSPDVDPNWFQDDSGI